MLRAWSEGNIEMVGEIFRADGLGLRDDYQVSGKELETMCDIVRTIPGVLGERMLGGGERGASGALVLKESEAAARSAVETAYPRSHPEYAGKIRHSFLQYGGRYHAAARLVIVRLSSWHGERGWKSIFPKLPYLAKDKPEAGL